MINVKVEGLKKVSRFLDPKLVRKAQNSAYTSNRSKILNRAVKEIKNEYNLKSTYIKKKVKMRTRWGSSTAGKVIEAIVIEARSFRTSLLRFGARQTKKGVSVKVMRKGARKLFKGAFIHKGITKKGKAFGLMYQRDDPEDRRRGIKPDPRLLNVKVGPSVPELLNKVSPKVIKGAGDRVVKSFLSKYAFFLSKVK